jgi:hypothetical protein
MRNERPREYDDRRATEFSAHGRLNGPRSAEVDSFRPVYDRPSARSSPPHVSCMHTVTKSLELSVPTDAKRGYCS